MLQNFEFVLMLLSGVLWKGCYLLFGSSSGGCLIALSESTSSLHAQSLCLIHRWRLALQELRDIRARAAERRMHDDANCGCTSDGFKLAEINAAIAASKGTTAAPCSIASGSTTAHGVGAVRQAAAAPSRKPISRLVTATPTAASAVLPVLPTVYPDSSLPPHVSGVIDLAGDDAELARLPPEAFATQPASRHTGDAVIDLASDEDDELSRAVALSLAEDGVTAVSDSLPDVPPTCLSRGFSEDAALARALADMSDDDALRYLLSNGSR